MNINKTQPANSILTDSGTKVTKPQKVAHQQVGNGRGSWVDIFEQGTQTLAGPTTCRA
jgi:hypothetical protein